MISKFASLLKTIQKLSNGVTLISMVSSWGLDSGLDVVRNVVIWDANLNCQLPHPKLSSQHFILFYFIFKH